MKHPMRDRPYGILKPSLDLQKKAGGQLKPLGSNELSSIENEINSLTTESSDWISEDMERLLSARNAFQQNVQSEESTANLYRAAHDLRGLGLAFGFPIVSIIAGSLCKSMKIKDISKSALEESVNAHVDAIRLVVKHRIREADSGPGYDLVNELSRLNAKLSPPDR